MFAPPRNYSLAQERQLMPNEKSPRAKARGVEVAESAGQETRRLSGWRDDVDVAQGRVQLQRESVELSVSVLSHALIFCDARSE
jgi:hypothetical protein